MSDPIVYGFPYSTFVHIVRLILTHKGAAYTFRDLETEMGKPSHLALHPFNRVPVLQHDDFTVYETSAIVTYIDETFEKPALQPKNARDRARMHQWMSAVNSYYYTYMIYHVTHERLVFPGSASHPMRRSWRTLFQKLRSVSRSWSASWRTARSIYWALTFRLRTSILCPAPFPSASRRKQGHVSQVPGLLPVAGDDGGTADRPKLPGVLAAARADRTRAGMGSVAPSEILTSRRHQPGAKTRSVLPAHTRRAMFSCKGSPATSP